MIWRGTMADDLRWAVGAVVRAIEARRGGINRPFLVAFDGGSGAGKSTLARQVAATVDSALIPADDFFAAHIADDEWATRTPVERARDVLDWRRLRAEVLIPLLDGRCAVWHPFDFAAGTRPDGTYGMAAHTEVREPRPVILLDGAYSTRPELLDLIDLTVLVDVPPMVRHARLAAREEAVFLAAWHARWDAAEAAYLAHVRPPEAFDLVVNLRGFMEAAGNDHPRGR